MTDDIEHQLFWDKYWDDDNRIDNETRFSVFSNSEQLEYYKIKAQRHWQWIKNIVDYAIMDHEQIILEWFHLRPSIIQEDLKNRWEKIRYICLYKSDVWEIEQGIKLNKHQNDRATKKTFKDETYPKIASFIYEFGQTMKNEADIHWLESYDMSIWDFKENLEKIVHLLEI